MPIGLCGLGELKDSIRLSNKNNEWILVENIHLRLSWLPHILSSLTTLKLNSEFKLWFTCQSDIIPPISILEQCTKLLIKPLTGIMTKFIQTEATTKGKMINRTRLLHAILHERSRFIPQGFAKEYTFSGSDLETAQNLIHAEFNSQYLAGLFEDLVYSAKIETDSDARILQGYMDKLIVKKSLVLHKEMNETDETILAKQIGTYHDLEIIGISPNAENVRTAVYFKSVQENLKKLSANQLVKTSSSSTQSDALGAFISFFNRIIATLPTEVKVCSPTASPAYQYFIAAERTLLSKIIALVQTDMSLLQSTLAVNYTPFLSDLCALLVNDQTPEHWLVVYNGPLVAQGYLSTLLLNASFILGKAATIETDIPVVFEPRLFMRPGALLHVNKLSFAMASGIELDALVIEITWKKVGDAGVGFKRLWIQGCIFDGKRMGDCKVTDAPYQQLPVMYVNWVHKSAVIDNVCCIKVPIYENEERMTVIEYASIPVEDEEEVMKWTFAGVAILLNVVDNNTIV